MGAEIIRVTGLVKRHGQRTAVDHVSFSAAEGEILGLLGPNGAGKTTTLSVLSTLLPPDEGQVTVAGHDVVREAFRVKALLGYVPQELSLFPALSARDNLAFFGRIYRMSERDLKGRIPELLELVGLGERAKEPVKNFSGGMMRRLNIAVGLIHRPRVLFLDEPTVGVDPQSRNFIFEHVERLRSEGMTVVYTTHYMDEAERLCDRVAIMDEGRIVALDSTRKLLELLGGGVIYAGFEAPDAAGLQAAIEALPGVREVTPQDGRVKITVADTNRALLELIELCNARDARIISLEMLEPNLESVFLHLTGKRLRD